MSAAAWFRRGGFIAATLAVVSSAPAAGQDWPVPPCAQPAHPAFGPIDSPPNISAWFGEDQREIWSPPDCVRWAPRPFASMIAVAGRFRNSAGVAALATRVGAISAASGIRYWSVSRREWRAYFVEAHALRTPDPTARRIDFTNDEVRAGAELYFLQQENNPTGPVVYRLSIRERDEGRLVLNVTNVSQARLLLIPIFDVGEQESITFLLHERDDVWRYYSLARVGGGPDANARDHIASLINRAVAVYRHLAGIPTDRDPPAAR